jgi:hypothetical protein
LLPTEYFDLVFTLPEPIAAIAFYNKEAAYNLLSAPPLKPCAPLPATRNVSACGVPSGGRLLCGAPYLGTEPSLEPSLMMHGIIISFVFSEQSWLILRTALV